MFEKKEEAVIKKVEVKEEELDLIGIDYSSTANAVKEVSQTNYGFSAITGLIIGAGFALYTHNVWALIGFPIVAMGFMAIVDTLEWGGLLDFSK